MQAIQEIHLQRSAGLSGPRQQIGLLSSLLGCRHRELSRAFTSSGETYRACLSCGARRQFDLETWCLLGPFFFSQPPIAVARMSHL
jgi:hypothetical protein